MDQFGGSGGNEFSRGCGQLLAEFTMIGCGLLLLLCILISTVVTAIQFLISH